MTPASPPGRPPIRLGSPAEIVDAIPYLVGFQPHDSLVVVSLRGPRGRVGLTARVDLPPPELAGRCAEELVPHLVRNGAWRTVLAAYPPTDGPDHDAVRSVAEAFPPRLAEAGIELADLLCVHDGRWWSLVCADPACCPPEGTPLAGEVSVLGAAMAVEGRAVLPSRAALESSIDPPTGVLAAAMAYALPRADGRLADRVWAGRREEVEAESIELFRGAVARRLDGGAELTVDDAARLIVGLDDLRVRDEVVLWVDGPWGDAARSLVGDLVRRAVPPFHVVPLAVLGWLAYQQGDGALAGMAAERALAADPGYGLARLLDDALASGVDPAVFRALRDSSGKAGGPSDEPAAAAEPTEPPARPSGSPRRHSSRRTSGRGP